MNSWNNTALGHSVGLVSTESQGVFMTDNKGEIVLDFLSQSASYFGIELAMRDVVSEQ